MDRLADVKDAIASARPLYALLRKAVDPEDFVALARPLYSYLDQHGADDDGYADLYQALDVRISAIKRELGAGQ